MVVAATVVVFTADVVVEAVVDVAVVVAIVDVCGAVVNVKRMGYFCGTIDMHSKRFVDRMLTPPRSGTIYNHEAMVT